jgi:hypothetical protein
MKLDYRMKPILLVAVLAAAFGLRAYMASPPAQASRIEAVKATGEGEGETPYAVACCSVRDADTQQPVLTATVEIDPGNLPAVTNNIDGIYCLPLLDPGVYTFTATAPGYESAWQSTTLVAGQVYIAEFALVKTPAFLNCVGDAR